LIIDGFVKSRKTPFFVIPAEAGIQPFQMVTDGLGSGFHRSDDFLRIYHYWFWDFKLQIIFHLTGVQKRYYFILFGT